MKSILTTYEDASGQAINYSKLGIFFNRNVSTSNQTAFSNILEV